MSEKLEGKVIKKAIAPGSKSARDAIVIVTSDHDELVISDVNANPFETGNLEKLVGKSISATGRRHGYTFLMENFEEL